MKYRFKYWILPFTAVLSVVLKLTGVLTWSWWIILIPTFIFVIGVIAVTAVFIYLSQIGEGK